MSMRFSLLFVFTICLFPNLILAENTNLISGEVDSSITKINTPENEQPNELLFQLTNGNRFIMFTKENLYLTKGVLVNVYSSSSFSVDDRKIVCIIEIKGVVTTLPDAFEFSKPIRRETNYGNGCERFTI